MYIYIYISEKSFGDFAFGDFDLGTSLESAIQGPARYQFSIKICVQWLVAANSG